MDILIRYGFSIEEIKNMMDTNIEIGNIEEENIERLITILEEIGCDSLQIKNILVANPFYLNRSLNDADSLIKEMLSFKIDNLQTIFDRNPFLLNLNVEDFKIIIDSKTSEGLKKEEIIDYISYELV